MENGWQKKWDMIKEVIFFVITTAFVFGWFMLVLLIISFVTLSVLHFSIEGIIAFSVLGTICYDIYYISKKVKEYRKNNASRD